MVLIKDKNQDRLDWPMGTIVGIKTSKYGHVRSATVKPHKRLGSTITERERDRPMEDIVLLQEVPQGSEPNPTHPETIEEEEDITIVNPPDNPSINNEV